MSVSLVIPFVFVFTLYLHLWKSWRQGFKIEPPGPPEWPVIGNLIEFRKNPLEALTKWRREYGDIVKLKLGSYSVLLLSSEELLKEAFQNEQFNARAIWRPTVVFSGGVGQGTLTSTSHEQWSEVRKFTLRGLSIVGFGRRSSEDDFLHNVKVTVDQLKSTTGATCLHDALIEPAAKYIWHLINGTTLSPEESLKVTKSLTLFRDTWFLPMGSILWMIPAIVDWFPAWCGFTALKDAAQKIHAMMSKAVSDSKQANLDIQKEDVNMSKTFVQVCRSYIWNNRTNQYSTFYGDGGETNAMGTLFNIFVTGAITHANSLNWACAYIAARPQLQKKLHDEIVEVMGPACSRDVKLTDMQRMPYTIAFMKEVFRMSSSAPFANFHETCEEVFFHGYWIPKGTVVIGNLYGENHDESVWGDPERFRPERFLEQGPIPPVLSFSVGLRTCPGQVFARNSFFLCLVTLLQNFKITFDPATHPVPPTEKDISTQSLVSLFRFAKPYKYCLEERR